MFIIYKTDAWHSYNSRDIIGLAKTTNGVIRIIEKQVKKEGEELDEYQLYNLQHLKQTQGYSGEGEFQFESIEENNRIFSEFRIY